MLLHLPLLTLIGLLASAAWAARLPAQAYLPPPVPQQLLHVERQQQELGLSQQQELGLPQQQEYALDLPLEPY
ncbi:uncharacterized protein [Drosophila virilis]|uniref:uncharacterized protein n=1 Tax=Drosophila virilis TaxID=7244 RepID=UPI00017D5B19